MSRACFRALFLGLVAAAALACSGPTSILLRVTSPLTVPGQVDGIAVQIEGDTAAATVDRTYVITGFPQTISLRPGPASSGHITITVTGLHGHTFVVQRVVHTMFVTGTEQTVVVDLPADCVDVHCADGIDCVHGACAGGSADAGVVDSGVLDAGPHDAGNDAFMPDSGPPDAGCASDTVCDDHVACTHDVCVSGACTNMPDDTLCAVGATCNATSGCPPRVCTMSSECDDGLFCNGVETCVGTACTAAAMSACDDGDNCTTDHCDETTDTCTHGTRDGDMDGFGDHNCPAVGGVPNTDCDDSMMSISPSAIDACDGLDNDCSGVCDDLNTCCRGTSGMCHTTCDASGAMTGSRVCTGTCSWSACSPPAETCNGRDDDCNGACDDGTGLTCCAGATVNCPTTCGTTGTWVCQPDCSFTGQTCMPPADVCNGIDDNCDGTPDNGAGLACAIGHIQNCTTTCGSTGTQLCSATCQWGACTPPVEICGNGIDDNCVGGIDEGCAGACGTCPGSTPVSGTGGRFSVNLGASSTTTGTCGGTGPEATLNFVLTVPSDVFITTHGATQNTVIYVRSCTCTGPQLGCNDDADGRTTSSLQLTNLPAGSYNVFIDTVGAASGAVPVDIYIDPTGTVSDRCATATAIAPGTPMIMGNTCGYNNDYDNVLVGTTGVQCPYAQDGNAVDRVYYFYLSAMSTVTMNGCTAGSNYDQVIYIRSVCNDATMPAQRMCNDDGCTGSPTSCIGGVRSMGSVTLPAGLYYAFIDGYDDGTPGLCSCGGYQFTLTGF